MEFLEFLKNKDVHLEWPLYSRQAPRRPQYHLHSRYLLVWRHALYLRPDDGSSQQPLKILVGASVLFQQQPFWLEQDEQKMIED